MGQPVATLPWPASSPAPMLILKGEKKAHSRCRSRLFGVWSGVSLCLVIHTARKCSLSVSYKVISGIFLYSLNCSGLVPSLVQSDLLLMGSPSTHVPNKSAASLGPLTVVSDSSLYFVSRDFSMWDEWSCSLNDTWRLFTRISVIWLHSEDSPEIKKSLPQPFLFIMPSSSFQSLPAHFRYVKDVWLMKAE